MTQNPVPPPPDDDVTFLADPPRIPTDAPRRIEPTIGRKVLFVNRHQYGELKLDATISAVNEDGTINIGWRTPEGISHNAKNVRLIQPGQSDQLKRSGVFCEWMPYQVGQATRTEDAEKALALTVSALEERIDILNSRVDQLVAELLEKTEPQRPPAEIADFASSAEPPVA